MIRDLVRNERNRHRACVLRTSADRLLAQGLLVESEGQHLPYDPGPAPWQQWQEVGVSLMQLVELNNTLKALK